jgi:hypothetical protein
MTAEAALQKQAELYAKMTPEQRARVALSLQECAWEVARPEFVSSFPMLIQNKLRKS